MNTTRPTNYLNSYLERVTGEVKVPKYHVKAIQAETEMLGNSTFDASTSLHKLSQIFGSKKGSHDHKAMTTN